MKNLSALRTLGLFAPTSFGQTTHIIDEFTSNNNYYSAFNNGSGSLNTSINRNDFASGNSSLNINYSFNAGANFFFTSLRNYGTTAQDYSYLTTAFSVTHKGGHADDRIAIRLWEDINGNGAFDGEDEVYQSTSTAIGTTDWTTSTFDLNSFTKVVGAGNGQIDLNRIRAWDIKISSSSSLAHNGNVLVDKFSLESSYTAPATGSAKLNGAFIQLWNTAGCKCGEWTQAQWDAEFQEMKDAQLDYLVVQYSVYHNLSWYSPSSIPTVIYKMNTLNRIVAAAEKVGMQVHFGLYFDETWNSSNKATRSTYSSIFTKHKLVVDELWDLFGASSAFGGWYVPQELNDQEWQDDPEKSLLFQWMKDVTDYTESKSATKPIMIAPFFNLWQPADQLEAWYDELLEIATNLDRVYPQDGVGITLKNPEYHIPLYYSAIKRACDNNGRTFGATIETFHQTSGWPVDYGSFSATSTDIATLKKQLWNAAAQQPDEMIQFAWSYMQPNLTSSSTNLYNNYRTYVEQNNNLNPTPFPTPTPTPGTPKSTPAPVTPAPTPIPTPAPVTPAPTPIPTPTPAPQPAGYKVVCGSSAGSCKNNPVLFAGANEPHEVRCCSDSQISGWVKKSTCKVWGESDLGSPKQCHARKTYAEAEAICANSGARLCTEDELSSDCTKGSGCGYDSQHNWSSTPIPKCTDDASCEDGLACTINTCSASGVCEVEQIPGCGKMVACGSTSNNSCPSPREKQASLGEPHEVRCCSDTAISGWKKRNTCTTGGSLGRNVWGESDGAGIGKCHSKKTYAEAEAICAAANARLCTLEEAKEDCARGTGCGFDRDHIWTSADATSAGSSETAVEDTLYGSTMTDETVGWGEVVTKPSPGKSALLIIAEEVVAACNPDKIKAGDLDECEELCLGRRCCFGASKDSCIGNPAMACVAYAGCESLLGDYE